MSQSKILQFCYLLETQTAFNLDKALEGRVSGCICKRLDDQPLPWIEDEERTLEQLAAEFPRHNIITSTLHEYQIYIGPFRTSDVLKFWQRRLFDLPQVPRDLIDENDHFSCYGTFRVSGEGQLIKDSLKLSGTPLLLGRAESESPEEIADKWGFSDDFYRYQEDVGKFFESNRQQLYDENKQVTGKTLRKIAHHIVYGYDNWQPDEFEEDGHWMRFREIGYWVQFEPREKDRTPMSSFLLKDIERVGWSLAKGNRLGSALESYLSNQTPERINLDNQAVQQQVLSPSSIPLGRWPANPDHHLSLQQQCAVNLAMLRTVDGGLFSVNGPPGTGKTTMLRDIVANIVVQRAAQMALFSNPNDAFQKPKTVGDEMPLESPYLIDESIIGYEITVASSNNGAVENISKELPAIGAVAEVYRSDARYFSRPACRVLQEEAWGLFSAVLGKKSNCLRFAELLWPKLADSEVSDDFLSALEAPFKLNWKETQAVFFRLKRTVETLIAQRQHYESATQTYKELQRQLQAAQQRLMDAQHQLAQHRQQQQSVAEHLAKTQEQVSTTKSDIQTLQQNKPSIFRRILAIFIKQPIVETYRARLRHAETALEDLQSQLNLEKSSASDLRCRLLEVEARQEQASLAMTAVCAQISTVEATLDEGRRLLGDAFADEAWWERPESVVQMSVPWIDRALDDARSRLFIAAMQVHQSFIEQAAEKFRRNIGLWATLLEEGWPKSSNVSHAITLWQSAFLVVPVVSTTFASVQSMFKLLGQESLGWLLIDEAGQAVPQAAIGAIWRSKRVVAVGDPLQLEPVFTLQPAVVEGLRQHFQIKGCWNPYSYSVQGLADRANAYGAEIMQQNGPLWVGCPLRVHRRCVDPMFSISNQTTYAGRMILANKADGAGDIPTGDSRWIQIVGQCEGRHWVAEQGEAVIDLLSQVFSYASELPEIYVITPFKEISTNLKQILGQSSAFETSQIERTEIQSWLNRSIGTVHTFQGKEADTVIFVLGLDLSKSGAAYWVSQTPNLLNVAVTRARYRLYIVGDKKLWRQYSYFRTAIDILDRK